MLFDQVALQKWITELLIGILTALFGLSATGCTFTLKNNGEAGFAQETRWYFFHEAKKTTGLDEPAVSETDIPALEDWILSEDEPPPAATDPAAAEPVQPDGD